MSHVLELDLEFADLKLLTEAVESLGHTLEPCTSIRYYGSQTHPADYKVPLHEYDLGFTLEGASDKDRRLRPLYDSYNGEVHRAFGKNLVDLSAAYYKKFLEQTLERAGYVDTRLASQAPIVRTEDEDSIVLELTA